MKLFKIIFLAVLCAGCESNSITKYSSFNIIIAPTVDAERILASTKDLDSQLKQIILDKGISIENINIEIAHNYNAAAESLESGSSLIGFMPPMTYIQYADGNLEPIIEGLRYAQNVNSVIPLEWNLNTPNYYDKTNLNGFFYTHIILGPSQYGKQLQSSYTENLFLTWNEMKQATWCFGANVTSGATYVYPNIWISDNYQKTVNDLSNVIPLSNSTEIAVNLASEVCDIAPLSSFSRIEYQDKWITDWNRDDTIWEETMVVGVSKPIANGIFVISKNADQYSNTFKKVLIDSLIELSEMDPTFFNAINLAGIKEIEPNYLVSTIEAFNYMQRIEVTH